MISIVCVYNDLNTLENCLLKSLGSQTAEYDLCLVDNTGSDFSSAAAALNHGAKKAIGEWLVFAHQDIVFIEKDWIKKTEDLLKRFQPEGWIGSAGIDFDGTYKGFMIDSQKLLGEVFEGLMQVQTLDECILICANQNKEEYFDESLKGWHQYGVDVCSQAVIENKTNYVLPFPIWHNSKRVNDANLKESMSFIAEKYKSYLDENKIYTTCGVIPIEYQRFNFFQKIYNRISNLIFQLLGYHGSFYNDFGKTLENITKDFRNIYCLHRIFPQNPVRVNAFTQFSNHSRLIKHIFTGFDKTLPSETDFIVVERDLAAQVLDNLEWLNERLAKNQQVLICVKAEDAYKKKSSWKKIFGLAKEKYLSIDESLNRIFILKF